jgi:hypothetical protein
MSDPFYVPTSFESLIYFSQTGNAGVVSHLLKSISKADLSDEQLAQVATIEEKLCRWLAIEAKYGPGASLNLGHTKAIEQLVFSEKNESYFAEYIPNAEKYRAISGDEWLWTEMH